MLRDRLHGGRRFAEVIATGILYPAAGDASTSLGPNETNMNDRILRPDQPSQGKPTSKLPQVELEIARGQARNLRRPVHGPVFLVGTAPDCDLVLGDPQFAEVHAYIFVTEEGVSLRHLGSEPTVLVCGRTVESAYLRDGDTLRMGPYEFLISIRWPVPAPQCDEIPHWLQPPQVATATGDPAHSPQAAVRQLLDEVRAAFGWERPTLALYVEPDAQWQTVTSSQPLQIRRQIA